MYNQQKKEWISSKKTPALIAKETTEDRLKELPYGGDDYFAKPFIKKN